MASLHIFASVASQQQFSSVGMGVLSSVIHLLGVSVLGFMLSMKVDFSEITTFRINHVSWPRLLVILNIVDSWAFMFTNGILVHGTSMELSGTVCMMGIVNCIVFYTTSKIIIYLFLAEKVYVVWHGNKSRFRSTVYMACLCMIGVYVGVIVFLILGRVAFFRDDGACVIGLTRPASLTLLIYDLCINIILTSLFVWPLLDHHFTTSLKGVATRTLWAAAVALTTSCVNILILTIMHGKQLGWVCLGSCGTDVVINAAVLCWVTSPKYDQSTEHSHGPSDPAKPFTSNVVTFYSTTSGDLAPAADSPRSAGRSRFPRLFDARRSAHGHGHGIQGMGNAHGHGHGHGPAVPAKHATLTSTRTLRGDDVELVSVSKILEVDRMAMDAMERDLELDGNGDRARDADRDGKDASLGDALSPLPSTPLIRTSVRAHPSTMRWSNTVLSRHVGVGASNNELQIIVTKETDVVTDDMPPPPLAQSPSPPSSDERW